MRCIGCSSAAVSERTAQGYRRLRWRDCGKQFNERGETRLNRTQYPSDVIALMGLWRLRYKFSLRDLPEVFLIRDIVFSHDRAVKQIDGRDWQARLAPALAEGLRRRRHGKSARASTSTRRTSSCTGGGAICIAPSTATARWST